MTNKEIIDVVHAHNAGKTIEYKRKGLEVSWHECKPSPMWNFCDFNYRVKPESKYRPYKSAQEFLAAQKEHGMYIEFSPGTFRFPTKVNSKGVAWFYNEKECSMSSFEFVFNHCKWQDGTPCGILEE